MNEAGLLEQSFSKPEPQLNTIRGVPKAETQHGQSTQLCHRKETTKKKGVPGTPPFSLILLIACCF